MPQVPRSVALVFLIALLIQVAVLPLRGTGDVRTFKEWGVSALSHGLLNMYERPDPRPSDYVRPDYPPLSVTLLVGAAAVMDELAGEVNPESRTLTVLVKLMILAAHLASSGLVLWLVRRRTGDDVKASWWALAYFINPALVMNGSVLGYLDSLCMLMGLLAMVHASMRRFGAAGVLAVIAAMIKPQGIFFLLPVAVAAWGSPGMLRMTMTAAVTAAVVLLPFVLTSGPANFMTAMSRNALDATLSGNALNLWWLATATASSVVHGWEVLDIRLSWLPASIVESVTGVKPRFWMALAVISVAAWVGWLLRGLSRLSVLAAYLAFVAHVYFVFAISVHENHQVYVVAPLMLVAYAEPAYRRFTLGLSLLVASNMLLFYGFGRDFPELPRSGPFLPVTVALSMVNIALLAVHARLFRNFYNRMRDNEDSEWTSGAVLKVA